MLLLVVMFITVIGSNLGYYTLSPLSRGPESARDPDDILTGRHTEKNTDGAAVTTVVDPFMTEADFLLHRNFIFDICKLNFCGKTVMGEGYLPEKVPAFLSELIPSLRPPT